MKIDDRSNLGAVSTPGANGAAGVESGGRRETSRGVDGSGPDRAELSGLAGKISQFVSKDAAGRAAKVEQLRAQVASGSYSADPAAISRGIVNDALASAAIAGGSSR
jgi:flagellar biosynthesis anti-sigma factor FlgM